MKTKNCFILKSFVVVFSILLFNCSGSNNLLNKLPEPTPGNGYINPKLVEAEFIIEIENIKPLNADSLKVWNNLNGVPENQKPQFLIWCSDIIDRDNQRVFDNKISGTLPTDTFTEFENGNKICFWDLSNRLNDTTKITIKRHFSYYTYDYKPKFDTTVTFSDYSSIPQELFYFFTKAEPSLEQTAEIINKANNIAGIGNNIIPKVKNIFSWVRNNMLYVYPPEKRGVLEAFEKLKGDCGQYSALFVTLCRCIGVPARQQSGLVIQKDNTFGYHVWSEIYVPKFGWIPMDATYPDGFGHLTNNRIYSSVGMNLPLKYVPTWATYQNQDAQGQRTDFMQFSTIVKNGFDAKITTYRKVINFKDVE
ncbi:MAG: transglutaminase-like domain-containing protein [bacterium]